MGTMLLNPIQRTIDMDSRLLEVAREEVEWFFSEAEEIGSSDVSICVRAIYDKLGEHPDAVSQDEIQVVRALVYGLIRELPRNEYA